MKKGSISLRCALLGIARSTYYEHTKRTEMRQLRDEEVVVRLRTLAERKKFKLGIKTLTMAYVRAHGELVNHKKVARLKRVYDIPTKIRARRYTKPQQPKQTSGMKYHQSTVQRTNTVPLCWH